MDSKSRKSAGMTSVDMVEAGLKGELDVLWCLGEIFYARCPSRITWRVRLKQFVPRSSGRALRRPNVPRTRGSRFIAARQTRYEQSGGRSIETGPSIQSPPRRDSARGGARYKPEWRILRNAAAAHPERAHTFRLSTTHWRRIGNEKLPGWLRSLPDDAKRSRPQAMRFSTADRVCATAVGSQLPSGRAHFKVIGVPESQLRPIRWIRRKLHRPHRNSCSPPQQAKQFNTLPSAPRWMPLPAHWSGRDAIFSADALALGLKAGDRAVAANQLGRYEGTIFPAPIARGNLQVHWPRGNVLLRHGITDPVAGVPEYNAMVTIEPVPN
jgi:hypothetical protein